MASTGELRRIWRKGMINPSTDKGSAKVRKLTPGAPSGLAGAASGFAGSAALAAAAPSSRRTQAQMYFRLFIRVTTESTLAGAQDAASFTSSSSGLEAFPQAGRVRRARPVRRGRPGAPAYRR